MTSRLSDLLDKATTALAAADIGDEQRERAARLVTRHCPDAALVLEVLGLDGPATAPVTLAPPNEPLVGPRRKVRPVSEASRYRNARTGRRYS